MFSFCYSLPSRCVSFYHNVSLRLFLLLCLRLLPSLLFGIVVARAQPQNYTVCHHRTVRYGTILCGTIRYGTIRYGVARCNTFRCGAVQYDNTTMRYDAIRCDTACCGTTRYGTFQYGIAIRYGMVTFRTVSYTHLTLPTILLV